MKSKWAARWWLLIVLLLPAHPAASMAGGGAALHQVQAIADFTYRAGPGDTRKTAQALALYGAKYAAVLSAADYLAGHSLLKDYGDRQMEVYCLVAGELQFRTIDESFSDRDGTYTVTIESRLSLADFVKAEIQDAAFEEEEIHLSWKEEMEPAVSPMIEPAQELSRAYRHIRKHQWRVAIIYLNHLQEKYPHWSALFLAKAMAFQGLNETERVAEALATACGLGNQEACQKRAAARQR